MAEISHFLRKIPSTINLFAKSNPHGKNIYVRYTSQNV